VLDIPVPVGERGEARHAATLADLQGQLWSLISSEARAADREIQHA
jgi:hypothetical protein